MAHVTCPKTCLKFCQLNEPQNKFYTHFNNCSPIPLSHLYGLCKNTYPMNWIFFWLGNASIPVWHLLSIDLQTAHSALSWVFLSSLLALSLRTWSWTSQSLGALGPELVCPLRQIPMSWTEKISNKFISYSIVRETSFLFSPFVQINKVRSPEQMIFLELFWERKTF